MPVQIKRRVVKKAPVEVTPDKVTQRRTLGTKRMASKEKELKSRISLWDVDSDNEKAPVSRGTIQLTAEVVEELYELIQEGEESVTLGVSIWNNDSDNEKAPMFTGLIKSPSEREAEIEAAKAAKSGGTKSRTSKRSK